MKKFHSPSPPWRCPAARIRNTKRTPCRHTPSTTAAIKAEQALVESEIQQDQQRSKRQAVRRQCL